MPRRLFVIHRKAAELEALAAPLRKRGWEVVTEAADVAAAYHTRLPSHERETVVGLQALKATRDIPIVFVGGTGKPSTK